MAVASTLKFGDYIFTARPSPSGSQTVGQVFLVCAIKLPGEETPELFKFFIDTGGEFSSIDAAIINHYNCPVVGNTFTKSQSGTVTAARNLYAGLQVIVPVAPTRSKMKAKKLPAPLKPVVADYSNVKLGSPGFWASHYPSTNILGSDVFFKYGLHFQFDYLRERLLITRA